MDAAQRMAFDYDAKQFLVWDEELTPQYNIEFLSSGYTSAISGDIGATVTGTVSGSTGTLVSFNNTTRIWVISTTDTFTDGEPITTTGTGHGTLIASAAQTGYVGPYDYPTDPAVRKLWGVTAETDVRIFGSDDTTVSDINDFDFLPILFDPKQLFKPGRVNGIAGTFTFIDSPALPSSDPTYRWVYWRNPPTIDGTSDETELIIPATYHLNFVNACVKLAEITLSGADVDPNQIYAFFKPWWNTLQVPYTPMGKASNGTQNPRQSPGIMI
jgi:hypothetical protein